MNSYFIILLDEITKKFGAGISIIAVITIFFFAIMIIKFDKKKLSIKRYIEDKEEHSKLHLKQEEDLKEKIDNIYTKLEGINSIANSVSRIEGYLFGTKKTFD